MPWAQRLGIWSKDLCEPSCIKIVPVNTPSDEVPSGRGDSRRAYNYPSVLLHPIIIGLLGRKIGEIMASVPNENEKTGRFDKKWYKN